MDANGTTVPPLLTEASSDDLVDAKSAPTALADIPPQSGTGRVEQTESLLIPDVEAARLADVGRSTWHRLRAAGKVPAPVKLGRSCRWRRNEIVAWIEAGCPDAKTWAAMQTAGRRNRGIS